MSTQPSQAAADTSGPGQAEGALALALIDHLDAMVAYWNQDRVCELANAAYLVWFGKSKHDVVGMTLRQLLGPVLYEKNVPYIDAAYAGHKQVFEREIPLPGGGGSRHSLATYVPHVVDGRVLGIFAHVADVTQLKRLEQQLQQAKERAESRAAHDVLTGLPNRLTLEDTIERLMAGAGREHQLLGVLAIDVDNFKTVNDRHGHAAGDRYLVELSARLRATLRHEDSLFRVGGDEFIAVLPGLDGITGAEQLAARLVRAAQGAVQVDGHVEQPAVSIGVALHPEHGRSSIELLAAADRALYAAKARGRNQYALP